MNGLDKTTGESPILCNLLCNREFRNSKFMVLAFSEPVAITGRDTAVDKWSWSLSREAADPARWSMTLPNPPDSILHPDWETHLVKNDRTSAQRAPWGSTFPLSQSPQTSRIPVPSMLDTCPKLTQTPIFPQSSKPNDRPWVPESKVLSILHLLLTRSSPGS